MDSVSLATPASVAATEKKTMTIESRLELADGCALIVSKRGVNITIDRYGDMHMKPNKSRRTRRSQSYYINNCLRQAERSHKHRMEGRAGTRDERGGVDREENGGADADEFSATDAAACLAASEAASSNVGVIVAAGETEQQEQQQQAEQTAVIEKAAAIAEAAAVTAVAVGEEEKATEAAMDEEAAAVEGDSEDDDEEEAWVPKRHAHGAGVGKRQAVEGAPTSSTPAPRAPRSEKFGLLSERAASSVKAISGIKKDTSQPSMDYTAIIYKEIKRQEQQARVQKMFHELRAAGHETNEAAAMAIERVAGCRPQQ